MENPKRRRGISLSHHQQSTAPQQLSLEKSAYVDSQPTTRMQYPRYHLNSPSRHASAPKGKIHFAYPLHPTAVTALRAPIRYNDLSLPQEGFYAPPAPAKFIIGINPPTPSRPAEIPREPPMSESLPLPAGPSPREKEETKLEVPVQIRESQSSVTIPEKYSSFEQCKEAIGKRLFGVGSIARRETALQETDRGNRWLQEDSYGKPEVNSEWKKEVRADRQVKQEEKQISTISQTSIEECVREITKVSEVVEPPKKRQLNIQHEVVNFAAERKPAKENVPPLVTSPPQKKQGRRRDPLKLQEMEKRLMEIIKICDENLS